MPDFSQSGPLRPSPIRSDNALKEIPSALRRPEMPPSVTTTVPYRDSYPAFLPNRTRHKPACRCGCSGRPAPTLSHSYFLRLNTTDNPTAIRIVGTAILSRGICQSS